MAPSVTKTLVGKIGNIYVVAFGTAPPFTIPPSASFDITTAVLPAAWLAGDLGYLHEEDTPKFAYDLSTERISAWQLDGNPLRILQTGKVRSVDFTCREINRNTWSLVEPGTTYTAGAAGSVTATIPNTAANPDKAALVEMQDLDFGVKVWVYIPKVKVSSIGELQPQPGDTANAQVMMEFLPAGSAPTDPLYYTASNHPGWAA